VSVAVLTTLLLPCCGSSEHGPPEPSPLFDPREVVQDFVRIMPCRPSHEHELHYVESYADAESAEIFRDCVLLGGPSCTRTAFPKGALFVKYEYEYADCSAQDLVGYTATLRLAEASSKEGHGWHWQRLSAELAVVSDGAPAVCLNCHIDHCSPPNGFDLRCRPD
jgi:hypothetical protein